MATFSHGTTGPLLSLPHLLFITGQLQCHCGSLLPPTRALPGAMNRDCGDARQTPWPFVVLLTECLVPPFHPFVSELAGTNGRASELRCGTPRQEASRT
ncbi:hypothetical protein MHYP_G00096460 [Metynnis hypsauchen]